MMQMYGTIFLYIIVLIFIATLFMCDYPEMFWHDVSKEFDADNQFVAKEIKGLERAKTQKLNDDNIEKKVEEGKEEVKETELAAAKSSGKKV
jgi:hypothetical protein